MLRFLRTLAFALIVFGTVPALAGDVGVVLLHGKWGTAKPKSPIGKLASKLKGAGFMVETPDMPWSRSRYYARGYEESMEEIDAAVQSLKGRGATRIVVGGQSMGGNTALGYGARRQGLAGIMVLAPGHIPENGAFQDYVHHDYKRAQQMVDAGRGGEKADFADRNQGKVKTISAEARIYLSWFNKAGPAVMPLNAADLKHGTPLLWMVGEQDRMLERGKDYAFKKAPSHPKSAYKVVPGGHKATPIKGAKKIIKWLKGL